MDTLQAVIIIAVCGAVTVFTRFAPFVIFRDDKEVGPRIGYLGRALPAALFAMLVVYCFKDVDFLSGDHGIPELVSAAFVVIVHLKWRNMLLSLISGVAFYCVICYLFSMI